MLSDTMSLHTGTQEVFLEAYRFVEASLEWNRVLVLLVATLPILFWLFRSGRKTHEVDENGNIHILDMEYPVMPLRFRLLNTLLGPFMEKSRPTVESVLAEVTKRTGLEDFGDEEKFPFREGLSHFLLDLNEEFENLTLVGRISMGDHVRRLLENRLRIIDLVKRHPEILHEEVKDPVFIVGPPRSGTTHMHRAMGKHDAFRIMKHYELMSPVITPDVEEALRQGKEDPRRVELDAVMTLMPELRPFFNHMHETSVDTPEEETTLIACTFMSIYFATLFMTPNYAKWHDGRDPTPGIEFLKLVLQVVQWQDARGGAKRKRFILKSPGHIDSLVELARVFPSAKIVQTYRNPTECIVSIGYLFAYSYGIHYKRIKLDTLGVMFVDVLGEALNKVVRTSGQIQDRSCIIRFRDYVKDNEGCIMKILDFVGEKSDRKAMKNVIEYLESRKRFFLGRIQYDAGIFGLNMKEVEKRFSPYIRYNTRLEKENK